MNKIELIGRLVRDPELRHTSKDTPVAKFTIALNDGYGENQQSVFIDITCWGKTGEFVNNYFKKGQQIGVVGKLRNNNYEDKNGNKIYTLQVIADEIEFVGNNKTEEPKGEQDKGLEEVNEIILDDDDLPF